MIFTTGTGSACSGGEHLELPITINGVERTLRTSREELRGEPPADHDEARQWIIDRLRSAIKESTVGVPTLAQIAAAVNNKTFEI